MLRIGDWCPDNLGLYFDSYFLILGCSILCKATIDCVCDVCRDSLSEFRLALGFCRSSRKSVSELRECALFGIFGVPRL